MADVKISAATAQLVGDLLADTKFPVAQTGETSAFSVQLAELFKLFVAWLDFIGTNPLDGASPLEIYLQAGSAAAASGAAGGLQQYIAGTGDGAGAGGDTNLLSGNGGDTGGGGSMFVQAGDGGATSGAGGTLSIYSGSAPAGNSGQLNLFSGSAGAGNSGAVWVKSGTATGTRGDVEIDGTAVKFGATQFAANAAVATVLGSVGPTGSHTTVQEWFVIKNAAGTVRYIPAF